MRQHYSIITQPIVEPISYDEAADHVRIDSTDDVELVRSLVSVAREMIDGVTGLASTRATFRLVADSWDTIRDRRQASFFQIPIYRTPLVSVQSVKYYDTDNTLQTVSVDDYSVITTTQPGCIFFPETPDCAFDRPDAVQVEFTAGHVDPCDVSPMHRHAIKMMVHHLYEQRGIIDSAKAEIPWTITAIINQIKVGGWCS